MKLTVDRVQIYHTLRAIEKGQTLQEALVETARGADRSVEEATALAAEIMEAVTLYEDCRKQADQSVEAAFQPFFERLDALEPKKQTSVLRNALLGLRALSDGDLLQDLENQDSIRERNRLLQERMKTDPQLGTFPDTPEELRTELLKRMAELNLSPKALQRAVSALTADRDPLGAALATGRSARNVRCALALSLYLQSQDPDLTPSLAASTACACADVHAVADAVHRGLITRRAASVTLQAIAISATVLGAVASLVCFGPVAVILWVAILACILGLGGEAVECARALTDRIGAIPVYFSAPLRQRDHQKAGATAPAPEEEKSAEKTAAEAPAAQENDMEEPDAEPLPAT